VEDFFLPEQELMNRLVAKESKNETKLNGPLTEVEKLYEVFKKQAKTVDGTLEKHVDALKLQTVASFAGTRKENAAGRKTKICRPAAADTCDQRKLISFRWFAGTKRES
jgi:hypothetical protein